MLSGPDAPVRPGNTLLLRDMPPGISIYNIELTPGKGGALCRSAGCTAQLLAKRDRHAQVGGCSCCSCSCCVWCTCTCSCALSGQSAAGYVAHYRSAAPQMPWLPPCPSHQPPCTLLAKQDSSLPDHTVTMPPCPPRPTTPHSHQCTTHTRPPQVRLPSGEVRLIPLQCSASVGSVSNPLNRNRVWGKAGWKRLRGIRPTVRGIAMNPVDHPHGGRTNGGRPSCSPWGMPSKGYRTRNKNKPSQKFIMTTRHEAKRGR